MKTHEPVLPTDVIQVEFRDFEKMGELLNGNYNNFQNLSEGISKANDSH